MKLRLAIFDADILYQPLQSRYHSYAHMFVTLLRESGADWDMHVYPVIDGVCPDSPDEFDACLITGSKYDSFGEEGWIVRLRDYVRTLYQLGKPMAGICFGHQLLAHALGGHTDRSTAGWGLGVMKYAVTSRPDFVVDDVQTINLLVSHQDQVQTLPPDAVLLLSNSFCPNAAFYIPGQVLAIQGHPEFTAEYARDLLDIREAVLPVADVSRARETFKIPHDGLIAGHWVRRFIETSLRVP